MKHSFLVLNLRLWTISTANLHLFLYFENPQTFSLGTNKKKNIDIFLKNSERKVVLMKIFKNTKMLYCNGNITRLNT